MKQGSKLFQSYSGEESSWKATCKPLTSIAFSWQAFDLITKGAGSFSSAQALIAIKHSI